MSKVSGDEWGLEANGLQPTSYLILQRREILQGGLTVMILRADGDYQQGMRACVVGRVERGIGRSVDRCGWNDSGDIRRM